MTAYRVLVSLDGGETWRVAPEIAASSPAAAIECLRDSAPAIKTDTDAQFVALTSARWSPLTMQKQLIEKWALGPVESDGQTKMEDGNG